MTKITIKHDGHDVSVFHLTVHSMIFGFLGVMLVLILISSTRQIFVKDVGQASSLLFVYVVSAYFFRNTYYNVFAYKRYVQDVVDVFICVDKEPNYNFQCVEKTPSDELNNCVVDLEGITLDTALRWAKDFMIKKKGYSVCIDHREEVVKVDD